MFCCIVVEIFVKLGFDVVELGLVLVVSLYDEDFYVQVVCVVGLLKVGVFVEMVVLLLMDMLKLKYMVVVV